MESNCELVACSTILKNGKKLFIISFYRPNDSNLHLDEFFKAIDLIYSTCDDPLLLIGGDFNLPGIDWVNSMHVPSRPYAFNSKRFIDYLHIHSLEQINMQPTRGTNVLELLITNSPEAVQSVGCDMGISDHGQLVHAELNYFPAVAPLSRRTVLNFEHADWDNFRHFVSTALTDTNDRFSSNSVNANWDLFKEVIDSGINKFIPKRLSRSSSEPIWYNTEIRRVLRQQQTLKNHLRENTNESLKLKFKRLRNKLKKLLAIAFTHFKQFTLGQSLKENPKYF